MGILEQEYSHEITARNLDMQTKGRFSNPLSAVLTGIGDRLRLKKGIMSLPEGKGGDGVVCLVTGANTGLGFGITVQLAMKGARVIMACRKDYSEALKRARLISGSDQIEMRLLDLTKVSSIFDFVENLKIDGITIDVSIHNAGVTPPVARSTEVGLDEMFMVNYLSKFIMVNALLDHNIFNNPPNITKHRTYPRIIFISSDSHRGASSIHLDGLGLFEPYSSVNRAVSLYSYNKLVLNTFAVELSRRLDGGDGQLICVGAICPGPVNSDIIRDAPWWLRMVLRGIFFFFFKQPMKAAIPVAHMALYQKFVPGQCLYMHMSNVVSMDEKCYDAIMGKSLWQRSRALTDSLSIST